RGGLYIRYWFAPNRSTTTSSSASGNAAGAAALKASAVVSPGRSGVPPISVRPSGPLARRQRTAPRKVTTGSGIEPRLAANLAGDRVRDEALVVRAVVQLQDVRARGQPLARERHARAQRDAHHGGPSGGVPAHDPKGIVAVIVDPPAAGGGQRQEPQHVAARERRDQRLFRIDRCLDRQRHPPHLRRGRRGHLDTAVEAPGVRPAVAIVGERSGAARPVDTGPVFVPRHRYTSVRRCAGLYDSVWVPPTCSRDATRRSRTRPRPGTGSPPGPAFSSSAPPCAGRRGRRRSSWRGGWRRARRPCL